MTGGAQTFTFTMNEAPEQAGIDPFLLLIVRVPEDNLREAQTAG